MIIKASRAQTEFINAKTRGRIFLGGIGSGKSRALCYSAIIDSQNNKRIAIISFSYRNLKDVIADTLMECCIDLDLHYSFNKGDMIFYVNSKPILLRSSENPNFLRGLNLDGFYLDEAREMTRETFDIMIGRIRKSEDSFWALVSTTRGKNWFYDLIKDEGLLDVFNTQYAYNESVTVVIQPTTKSPFLPKSFIEDLKKRYTNALSSQELDALIIDMSGSVFSPDWFKHDGYKLEHKGIRFWDFAVTTNESSDYSANCYMSVKEGKYYINDIYRCKLQYPDLKRLIVETAIKDTNIVEIGMEDSGQQRAIIDDIRRVPELANFTIRKYKPTKDKVTRSYPFASQAELGNVILNPNSRCIREFKDECSRFSSESTGHDDMVDAVVSAYHLLAIGRPTIIKQMRIT